MSETPPPRAGPAVLSAALDALPEGVIVFASDWTVLYVNEAGADLMDGSPEDLVGRSVWHALPQLAGTIFHSFLLRAADADQRVTWQGFHAASHRWLSASAICVDELLHVRFHELAERQPDSERAPSTDGPATGGGELAGSRERLRFLAEVSEAMISTLDTGESATMLAELVVGRLCDWAIVSVRRGDGSGTDRARAHVDPALLADVDAYLDGRTPGGGDESPMAQALLSGQPVQLATIDPAVIEASLATDEARRAWRRLATASCIIVPLRARGETFGALTLLNSTRPPHSELQIATAVEAARRGALALDNARLYGRQLRVAETLQRSLLSPPTQPATLEIAVRYRPASDHMHVGGDWYDALQLPDGAHLVVIGDVVGHNVDAAAAMGQIRSTVRSIAYDRRESPARILERVDRVLTGVRIGTLATVLVARLEQARDRTATGQHTLRWCSAGHPPPLLMHPGGGVDVLTSTPELLLGTGSAQQRCDHETVLGPGDTLLLYTDGLVEHGRIDLDVGISRLTRALREVSGLGVDELCDRLLARIVPQRSDDDIALVAVRGRLGAGDGASRVGLDAHEVDPQLS